MTGWLLAGLVLVVLATAITLLWWRLGDTWADSEHKKFNARSRPRGPAPTVVRGFERKDPPSPVNSAESIISRLGLVPHPAEGGYFRETYRSDDVLTPDALPGRYGTPRAACTQIYYLLTPDTCSALHRVRSDETFHFYMGDPVEQLWLCDDDSAQIHTLGVDLEQGQHPQLTVPHGTWQGARLAPPGPLWPACGYALLGCTVSPGFDPDDFSTDGVHDLPSRYPAHADLIRALTPG